jgi:hypothetical protein
MSLPPAVAVIPPARLAASLGGLSASALPWVVRVSMAHGPVALMGLRPETAADVDPLDDCLAAALAADLLRSGWLDGARPLTTPIVAGARLYRGFSLRRDTTLPLATVRWAIDALVVSPMAQAFDWPATVHDLDQFASAFRPFASSSSPAGKSHG